MKILLAIPHYYYAAEFGARHASMDASKRVERLKIFENMLASLYLNWICDSLLVHQHMSNSPLAPKPLRLDIVFVVSQDRHFLHEQTVLPSHSYQVRQYDGDPLHLGFQAHQVLLDYQGQYDYYGYLEDDLLIEDPNFFMNLDNFNQMVHPQLGSLFLLQPNRYEARLHLPVDIPAISYIDYYSPQMFIPAYKNIYPMPEWFGKNIKLPVGKKEIIFERTSLPHSGCFFLTEQQLEIISKSVNFATPDVMVDTWLDTAASYAISLSFVVMKPARESISWFRLRHCLSG
jgi:hypothetical protein